MQRVLASLAVAACCGVLRAAQVPVVQAPRDLATAPAAGRAAISGLATTPDGVPVVRAVVTLWDARGQLIQSALTDTSGAFKLLKLPAGKYRLETTMPSFLTASYGQRKPGGPGSPLTLADDQIVRDVRLKLVRGGVISGTVVDPAGQPASGSSVHLLRRTYMSSGARLVDNAMMLVDDRGQYRFHGLLPGDYIVVVERRENAAPEDADRLVPTYFPNATSPEQATPISVGPAEERAGIDLRQQVSPVFTVRGQVAGGGPAFIWFDLASLDPMQMFVVRGRPVDAEGRFVIQGVLPGVYRIMASNVASYATATAQADRKWSVREVVVGRQDVADLTLILTPGATVAGRAVYAGRAGAPQASAPFSLDLTPVSRMVGVPDSERLSTRTDAAGRFRIVGVPPGRYVMFAGGLPAGWWAKSAMVDGSDALDATLDASADISELLVTIGDSPGEISGRLTDIGDRAAAQFTVIAFAADSQFWGPGTRRIREATWDADGRFHAGPLPPGRYLLAVLQDAEKNIWYDPRFLETLRGQAVLITLADGQTIAQDLRIKQP